MTGLGPLRLRALAAALADGMDGVGIDLLIALGIGHGARAFAQHVEAAQPLLAIGALEGTANRAPDDELLTHHADGRGDRLTDDRLADPSRHAPKEARQVAPRILVNLDQLARQHQAPGRGVDEQAVGLAHVAGPVGRSDLLGDQPVTRILIGGAQQGLGEAHEGQTLARAQRELLQEAFDHTLQPEILAGRLDQRNSLFDGFGPLFRRQGHPTEQVADRQGLVGKLDPIQRVPVPGQGGFVKGGGCVRGHPAPLATSFGEREGGPSKSLPQRSR